VQGREERRASRLRNRGGREGRQSRPAGRRGIGPGLLRLDQTMRQEDFGKRAENPSAGQQRRSVHCHVARGKTH